MAHEPKIVTMHCAWDVRVKLIDNGLAIIADDGEETEAYICLDITNATALRDALTAVLEKGGDVMECNHHWEWRSVGGIPTQRSTFCQKCNEPLLIKVVCGVKGCGLQAMTDSPWCLHHDDSEEP
jgi:hypothetical protein